MAVAPLVDRDAIHWKAKNVHVTAVAAQILALRQASSADEEFPLTRASVMNLIAFVDRPELVEAVIAAVDDLALRHPSRAIVVATRPGNTFALDADVVLHRHPLAAHGLVFERVVLRTRGASPEGLDTLVIPLLIPHLQSVLWWLGDPDAADPALQSVCAICDRLVVDTAFGPASRLGTLPGRGGPGLPRPHLLVGDMTWTRLTAMRETLARVFDEGNRAAFLDDVTEIEVTGVRGAREPVTAAELLFAGWIASRLGYSDAVVAPGGVSLRLGRRSGWAHLAFRGRRPPGVSRQPVSGVRLVAGGGRRVLSVGIAARGEHATVEVTEGTEQHQRTVPMVVLPEAEVLSRELGRLGDDVLFDQAVAAAADIAAALSR